VGAARGAAGQLLLLRLRASNHLLGEFLNGRLGLQMQHVPFRGGAPGMQAVMQGATQLFFENTPT
jgi:tripartite-type tricarboxylate transporter receptor subunit TctC